MIAAGTVVDVGQLDDGALGVVLERQDGSLITIKGLTEDETRAVMVLLFGRVTLMVSAGVPP